VKNLNRGRAVALGLALVAAGFAAPQALSATAAQAAKPDPSVVAQMRDTASGGLSLRANPATGKVGFARATGANPDLLPGVAAEGRQGAIDKATRYLDRFGTAFGAGTGELKESSVYSNKAGWAVTFKQSYKGLPVFGAELNAHVDKEGDLTSVNGFASPIHGLSTTPGISADKASAIAVRMSRHHTDKSGDGVTSYTKGVKVRSIQLSVYRMGSTRGITGTPKLAWVIETWNKATIRDQIILDAQTGKYLNRWSMMADALDRDLYEAYIDDNGTPDDPDDDFLNFDHVWTEGADFPDGLDQDQQNEVLGTGEAYWMFRNTFGYNSWDDHGSRMITVNNDPRIDCPNANWNGQTTNYCSGVSSDDTVIHEWAHAYTETTSGLVYQWQSGAMNEAYSDIWGETGDMLNQRMNDKGETPGDIIKRTEGQCSEFTRHPVTMDITAPASVAGPCNAAPASFGPVITQAGVDGTAIVGIDDDSDGTSTTDGCTTFTNAGAIAGQWVYVDRGSCTFVQKTANAEDAGALGIVVGDNVSGRPPISMSGDSSIYGVMVSLEDGVKFKTAGGPVSFHIAAVPGPADDTYRWLSGENDPAFGGAIRDMWNPNCYGDPGKVSDEEYQCSDDDHGGVHTNSGVVNRTYAILVDGLPGKVTPIGLDKAAWLFWQTQTNYLTPTSYFPDLADGLLASCEDLQGVDLERVTLGNPTDPDGSDGGVKAPAILKGGLTAADCGRVKSAIQETELRLDPTEECAFQPILQKDAPKLDCGADKVTKTEWSEDFESGLDGWTQDEELTFPEGHGYAWETSTSAPGHGSTTAFGPDPLATGDCGGGADDISSRNGLISPDITVPSGTSPRLSFDHYVATEALFDGGNVKVSVNGGAFELVPNDAYIYNAPGNELETAAGGNTNPMEGEPAWTGTDGGQVGGSWGTSIIDLSAIASAGDTVNFRFDMGRDGCNGVEGWYLDNVKVQDCKPAPAATKTKVVKVTPDPVIKGNPFKVKIKVTSDGGNPTGDVVLKFGRTKLGMDALNDNGVAKITVRRIFGVGTHDLVAKYLGAEDFLKSRTTYTIKVVRR
jgi:Zn-dependent metalloprotease